MKKIWVIFFSVLLVISLVACNGNKDTNNYETTYDFSVQNSTNENSENIIIVESTKENIRVYDDVDLYEYEDCEGGITIIGFDNYDLMEYDQIIIPSYIDGSKVVGIGSKENEVRAFSYICGSCEVVVPDTVEFIGNQAFFYADGLVKVSGGANCKTIGNAAFGYCKNLKEVTFIDNVESVAGSAFDGCTSYNQ